MQKSNVYSVVCVAVLFLFASSSLGVVLPEFESNIDKFIDRAGVRELPLSDLYELQEIGQFLKSPAIFEYAFSGNRLILAKVTYAGEAKDNKSVSRVWFKEMVETFGEPSSGGLDTRTMVRWSDGVAEKSGWDHVTIRIDQDIFDNYKEKLTLEMSCDAERFMLHLAQTPKIRGVWWGLAMEEVSKGRQVKRSKDSLGVSDILTERDFIGGEVVNVEYSFFDNKLFEICIESQSKNSDTLDNVFNTWNENLVEKYGAICGEEKQPEGSPFYFESATWFREVRRPHLSLTRNVLNGNTLVVRITYIDPKPYQNVQELSKKVFDELQEDKF